MDVGVGNTHGKVVLNFPEPIEFLVLSEEAALGIAEDIARQAFEVRTGVPADDDDAILRIHVRRKAIDQVRPMLITRAAHIVRSLVEKDTAPGIIAQHVVDAVLQEVT